jgi:hypothetical protein
MKPLSILEIFALMLMALTPLFYGVYMVLKCSTRY